VRSASGSDRRRPRAVSNEAASRGPPRAPWVDGPRPSRTPTCCRARRCSEFANQSAPNRLISPTWAQVSAFTTSAGSVRREGRSDAVAVLRHRLVVVQPVHERRLLARDVAPRRGVQDELGARAASFAFVQGPLHVVSRLRSPYARRRLRRGARRSDWPRTGPPSRTRWDWKKGASGPVTDRFALIAFTRRPCDGPLVAQEIHLLRRREPGAAAAHEPRRLEFAGECGTQRRDAERHLVFAKVRVDRGARHHSRQCDRSSSWYSTSTNRITRDLLEPRAAAAGGARVATAPCDPVTSSGATGSATARWPRRRSRN